MGLLINAICPECNFEKDLNFGIGENNYMDKCYIPIYNKKSGRLVTKFIREDEELPANYLWYTAPEMSIKPNEATAIQFGEMFLQADGNLCPKCKKYTMQFVEVGLWD